MDVAVAVWDGLRAGYKEYKASGSKGRAFLNGAITATLSYTQGKYVKGNKTSRITSKTKIKQPAKSKGKGKAKGKNKGKGSRRRGASRGKSGSRFHFTAYGNLGYQMCNTNYWERTRKKT